MPSARKSCHLPRPADRRTTRRRQLQWFWNGGGVARGAARAPAKRVKGDALEDPRAPHAASPLGASSALGTVSQRRRGSHHPQAPGPRGVGGEKRTARGARTTKYVARARGRTGASRRGAEGRISPESYSRSAVSSARGNSGRRSTSAPRQERGSGGRQSGGASGSGGARRRTTVTGAQHGRT